MKKASSEKQEQHDLKKAQLWAAVKKVETKFSAVGMTFNEIWDSSEWKSSFRACSELDNTCPECGSRNNHLENHSLMWHDGDVVCDDCDTYVRMWDAG